VRKGHGDITIILNADTGELLHMAEGKKKEAVETFLEKLSESQRASILAAASTVRESIRPPSASGFPTPTSFTTAFIW
jgi:hypothetical protein